MGAGVADAGRDCEWLGGRAFPGFGAGPASMSQLIEE